MRDIKIITSPISKEELLQFAEQRFGDMVKGVIDIDTGIMVLGEELHADEEAILLENGSSQEDLWGFNIYINESFPDNIEFDSMINIRPSQGNRSRSVEDPEIQTRILALLKDKLC
jgi:Protein of unknown function (DUF5674)